MRKEIIGILLFFVVIFTLISLVSYSPEDPSIFNAGAKGEIHNLFGPLGAHLSGILVKLFGMGVFWIPLLFLFLSIHFFSGQPSKAVVLTVIGGILLIITTGSLLHSSKTITLFLEARFLQVALPEPGLNHMSYSILISQVALSYLFCCGLSV